VALIGTTLFGVYLATRYSSSEILRILVWTLSIAALLSVVFAVALPSYGISSNSRGAWRGIYPHKNALGSLMGVNAVLLLLLKPRNWRYRWALWAGVGLSVSLVLLSTSKGALVSFLVLLTLLPLYRSLRWNYTLAIPFLITLLLIIGGLGIWLLENLDDIVVNKLGKDLTFTGRTVLWEAVIEMIQQRPLLGYGYSAFWRGWEGPSASLLNVGDWAVPNSHNGILDLWLDLGLVGVIAFMLGLLMNFVRAVRQMRLAKTAEALWPLTLLTFIVLINLVESAILKQNNIYWILYVVTVFTRPAQRL
jgi:O-antigen ligase